MRTHFDVLIIGGGLVGASLACALRDSGLVVGVIDAVLPPPPAAPSYDDRTLALADGSRRIFAGIGVWDDVARAAMPIRRIHISDRGRFGVTRLDAADAGLDALGHVVTFRALAASLHAALAGRANVDIIAPATVESVSLEDARAIVRARTAEGEREFSARLLVAADGANSPVRDALGIEARRVDYGQTAIVTSVTTERPPADTAYERFTETGPLALLPADAERFAVIWTVPRADAATVLDWDDATFRARLEENFGERLGRFTRVGKRQSFALALTRIAEHVRARLAVIGNAAHTLHPVAGQGFNLGLRDVAALAEILSQGASHGADLGDRALLDRYADWRVRDNRVSTALTHSLVRVFSNDYAPLAWARNLGLLAVDLFPPAKRGLIRITSGLAGRLPRLARGLSLSPP